MRHPRVAHRVGPLVDQPYDPGLASYNATLWPRVDLLQCNPMAQGWPPTMQPYGPGLAS